MYRKFFKRALDILLSAAGTLVLSPLFLLISAAVKLEDHGPVFFSQQRIGTHRRPFRILKFRTMRVDTPHDTPTHLLENPEQWITRVGRVLRKTSLDELPQILQILTGRMSVVGPRPALWNQYDLIVEREKYGANDVTPGLTGWAQVNGRDSLEIEEKARLDGEYARELSFRLDVKIFFMTLVNVIRRQDVVEGGTGALKGAEK